MRASLLVLCLLFIPSFLRAETDKFPVPRGLSNEPQPYRYDPEILKKLSPAFLEEVPAVTLYAGTSHRIEPDGTTETTTHDITRFNGRRGIEQYAEFRSIWYDATYETLTLNAARILKKDGKTVEVEPRYMHLRDGSTDYQVYNSSKQLIISFPNLEVGDAYEVKWTVRGNAREFGGRFFTRYTFGDDAVPVVLDELHVALPETMPFHHAAINGKVERKERSCKGTKYHAWSVRERWPTPKEEDRPSKEVLRLQVICSTFPDWKAVAAWKEDLRKDCWECTAEVRRVVKQVTKRLTNPRDKAKALTYWVRENIRYLSRGPAGTGYTPHKPAQVLKNLFGDCKDQAQLLAVMLREVGLDPYLVTLGCLDDGQVIEEVPCPWGTHAILMVPIDGVDHWIDTTANMAPWDWLPRADRGRLAYLTRRGEVLLKKTPPYTLDDNRIEQSTHVAVQGDGTSLCRRIMFYHGGVALGRRESWVEATIGERRRFLNNEIQDAFPRSRLEWLDIPEKPLMDWDAPVQAQLSFVIPRHFLGDGPREASVTDSPVWGRILAYDLDPGRKLPLNLGSPFESIHVYVIQLPPAYRFDGLPREKEVESPWGWFRLKVDAKERTPRRLELVMHTKLRKVLIEPADFPAFQKFHEDLAKSYRVWLSIKPTTEIEDAPLLETLLAVAPGADAFAARTLAGLYIDHDRWEDARRVLDQACVYHPGDHPLWDLRIKAAKNLADREQVQSALVRYFPGETKYALALGETRVKRGDFKGAHKVLTPLVKHPDRAVRGRAYYEMARMSFLQGQTGVALLHFEAARHMDPDAVAGPAARLFLGKLHEQRGETEEAIRAYRAGLNTDKDNSEALVRLIRMEHAAGQTLEALDHLRRLVLLSEGNLTALIQAAELYHEMGRLDEALELALRARALGYQGRVQRLLGLLSLEKRDYEKAAFHLERGDLDAGALEGLIQAHVYRGELAAAHRHLDGIARLPRVPDSLKAWQKEIKALAPRYDILIPLRPDPDKPLPPEWQQAVSAFLCADLALRKDQPRELIQRLLEPGFASKIDLGPAFGLRAYLHLEEGRLRKALEDVEKAIALGPEEPRVFMVRGRVRLERGEAGAVDDLRKAAALCKENDGQILHWLAAALHQEGRLDEALAAQRKAVALLPRDRELSQQLSLLEKAKSASDSFPK